MHNVQSEKVAVFLPLNVLPPKKKSTSCKRGRERERKNKQTCYLTVYPLSPNGNTKQTAI